MNWIIINDYYKNIDYLLFGVGFVFIALSLLLLAFFRKRRLIKKEKNFPLFILYVLFFGISSWNDLAYLYFPDKLLLEKGQYLFYLIAYVSLLEFARRELMLKKKTTGLYAVLLIIFLVTQNSKLFITSIAFISMLFSCNAIWLKLRKKEKRISSLPFILLNLISISFLVTLLFRGMTDNPVILKNIHLIKYIHEWSFAFIISIIQAKYILNFVPNDPLEFQLKKLRLRLLKIAIAVLLILYFFGYIFINHLEQDQFNENTFNLLTGTGIASLSINPEDYQQLKEDQFAKENQNYLEIENMLRDIARKFKYANSVYTIYFENEGQYYGLSHQDLDQETGQEFKRSLNLDALLNGDTILEKSEQYLTSFAPIHNQQGELVGALAIETATEHIIANSRSQRLWGISHILIAFSIVVFVAFMYYVNKRQLTWRTNHLKILSSIGDIVGIFNGDGEIIYANNAAINLTGAKEGISRDNIYLKDFLDADNSFKVFNLIKNLKKDGVIHTELTIRTIDNRLIPIYGSISYLDYEHNDSLYVFTAVNISEQKRREKEIKLYFHNTLSLLATVVDAKDFYTAKHSTNVAEYAKKIAIELGLEQEKIAEIEIAAFIHDIGKIAIPDSILKKDGPLNEQEWIEMKKHPEYGKQILEKAGSTFEKLIPYVYHHHERYDGKGYPEGVKNLPLEVCIISVADAFDAMTSNRSYRKRMPVEKAIDELVKNSGTQFHPTVVDALIKILKRENVNYEYKAPIKSIF